jgi:hypothetical protein
LELKNAHAGNADVQACLYVICRREYENFTHLPSESINALFQRFTMVMNNMRANVDVLPYDDHDRAVKLIHALDRTVWDGKVKAILESEKYTTLTANELFSKLNSVEVDRGLTAVLRARLIHIVLLLSVAQVLSLTLTHPLGCLLCPLCCLCQTRSLTCLQRTSWRC